MKKHSLFAIVALIFLILHSPGCAQYAFMVGHGFSGDFNLLEIYSMDESGKASLRAAWHAKDDMTTYGMTGQLVVSKSGHFACAIEDLVGNVGVYAISKDLQPKFVLGLNNEAGAGGFTVDDKFFITCQETSYFMPGYTDYPRLEIYEENDGRFQRVFAEETLTTTALNNDIICNSHDEIIASALNGALGSASGMVVYQLNRATKSLSLKQYLPGILYSYSSMSADEKLIACTHGGDVILVERRNDGVFQERSRLNAHPMTPNAMIFSLAIAPNGRHIIAAVENDDERWCGLGLMRITADKTLQWVGRHALYRPKGIAISPDGKFAVTGDQWGRRIAVYRFQQETESFEEVFSMPHLYAQINWITIFPNAKPTAAGSEWLQYSETGKPHPSPPRTLAAAPGAPSQRPSNSLPRTLKIPSLAAEQ